MLFRSYYFWGLLLYKRSDIEPALARFRAAIATGSESRRHLRDFGWDDGETEDLVWVARVTLTLLVDLAQLEIAISNQLRPSVPDLDAGPGALVKLVLITRVKKVRLSDDPNGQIIAQASDQNVCGATGNCPFWVFEKRGKGFVLLLESFGQVYTIEAGKTEGYHDLVVATHGSAFQKTVNLYQFEAGRYERRACHEFTWPSGTNDQGTQEPTFEPCH